MTTSLNFNHTNSDRCNTCLLAAIDIGTNSIHMVVVEIDKTLLTFTIINRKKDTVRLGEREAKTRKLTTEAIERAIASLKRCKDLATSLKVDHIVAIATSATREAPNGQDFIQRVLLEVGIQVDLISGYEEARRIYLGVLSGMDFQDRPHVIIDIGGGSTEIILADVHEPRFLSSTKVGAVRLTEELITTDPVGEIEFANLRAYVRGMLERPINELRCQLGDNEQPQLVGTSGTIETLMTINALQKLGEVPNPLQGYRMGRKEVKDLVKKFASMTYEERLKISGMSDKRAEIIVAGGVILVEAMAMLTLDNITVCERALREGMIVDWMLTHKLIEDRLCYQGKVRHRSVYQIAQKYQVNIKYSERVAQFAQSLFEQLKGILHNWGTEEWELLWAATILHKCGLYVSHSAYHKHSYYLIRNAELLGFTELELETIANLARYHRKSIPKKKHEPYSKLPDTYRKIVKQLSTILRLAVALNSRQIGVIKTVECKYDKENEKLYLYLIPTDSNDDCALELWNLDYNKLVFENEFGVKVVAILNQISIC
ncbi:exopolyphosphatase [cyanobacterium endosymbiont of Rhopalodia gibberula]|uniref:Ppx/GppA phosphatase family protein n=1 Tax=cyanobacterium endosymbiont of Rhopalodia gibberula TaxID=1763363 RepID=UPI000DC6F7DC|nr:Ppx/GppA phosphatase family protein [cyanobacterium endosymbiont of Rhopalodia gibberula]BBA78649.1 exopolyphosphatase [cyanobacterium endosymbiont of Rhopalodia gibberula]